MNIKLLLPIFISATLAFTQKASAQSRAVMDFTPVCDSLRTLLQERTGVEGELILKSVTRRGSTLNFYFTSSLGEYPWRKSDPKWFRTVFRSLFPAKYSTLKLGSIYSKQELLEELVNAEPGSDGKPAATRNRVKTPATMANPLVRKASAMQFDKGFSGRNIALWASHGNYYDLAAGQWQWQRPCLFQTVEDVFTSSYVLQYLVPMLENAGAYVMMPRERDTNPVELVIDNDPSYTSTAGTPFRGDGHYDEIGRWKTVQRGFADTKEIYSKADNPFTMGTARTAACIKSGHDNICTATWAPNFPQRNEYAVYVSYKSFPNSTNAARYIVHHLGGTTEFYVNQKIGGGTWIYLGTFEFDKGCYVSLSNVAPAGRKVDNNSIVCADAVKFGGGMGNIARGPEKDPDAEVSGLPRYAEAARYWLQWAGMDTTVFSQNEWKDDYKDDLYSRGEWVDRISGGSRTNPKRSGLGIPVDLSFALHTDAGTALNDTIIGTLTIYSASNEVTRFLPTGEKMATSREYADMVQSQIVHDLRMQVDSNWTRRVISERGYRESRCTPAPTVLLECHSHQNFHDMKFGLDPAFRFTFSRAVYKGMLKYLSNRYGTPYVVQPLPVKSFAARLKNSHSVELSWEDTLDPLEITATPKGYILYTRLDDGGFDDGKVIHDIKTGEGRNYTSVAIAPGHLYSFRIEAYNDGGRSFPSETMCAGVPFASDSTSTASIDSTILIINNFTRLSAPVWFEDFKYGGFDNSVDRGVQYRKDISFIGEMFDRDKSHQWESNDNAGFGMSYSDFAGNTVAANTFDYPYIHGRAIFKAGYPICSSSSAAFAASDFMDDGVWAADLICGKQVTTLSGSGKVQYSVFSEDLQNAVTSFALKGKHLLISGEYIGTDIWNGIFPVEKDSLARKTSIEFAENILGFRWRTNFASRGGTVRSNAGDGAKFLNGTIHFNTAPGNGIYPIETPDAIEPVSDRGRVLLRYTDTGRPAGVGFAPRRGYRVVSIGFPVEAIPSENELDSVIRASLKFFTRKDF